MRAPRIATLALVADVVALVVFAAIGRAGHAEADSLGGLTLTAAPFLAGVAVAWATPWVRARPAGFAAGGIVLAAAAIVGFALRAAFLGRLPLSFVLVATISLAVLLLGWRGVAALTARITRTRHSRV